MRPAGRMRGKGRRYHWVYAEYEAALAFRRDRWRVMRMRSHRRNSVVWQRSAGPAERYGALSLTRSSRHRRSRWWLHAGMVLSVIGIRRLARMARARWRPIFLVTGGLLLFGGMLLPSTIAFVSGMLVLGLTAPDARARGGLLSPTTAMVCGWSQRRQADHS